MNRVIIVGSPREGGKSAALADELFEGCIEECPEDYVLMLPVSTMDISACLNCGGCAGATPETSPDERCVLADDMAVVYEALDDADELLIVAPVFFAGPSASLKALMDRLQPYFRMYSGRTPNKRPAYLYIVGEGGDPYGYGPLVITVKSAFACAGFSIAAAYDWVGKIGDDGEFLAEPTEVDMSAFVPQRTSAQGGAGQTGSSPKKAELPKAGKASGTSVGKSAGKSTGKAAGKSAGKSTGKAAAKKGKSRA